jgi:hypothetical protein
MLNEMFIKYDLVKLQNNEANCNQDHLTFCAFFTTEKEFADLATRLQSYINDK